MKCWNEKLEETLGFAAALRAVVKGDRLHGVQLSETVGIAPPTLLLRSGKLLVRECRGISPLRDLVWQWAWLRELQRKTRNPGGPILRKLEGRVLIETVSIQDRSRALWEPLAQTYGGENCILLAPNEDVRRQLPPEYTAIALSEIPGDWALTRLWLLMWHGRWHRRLQRVCRDFDLAEGASLRLAGFFAGQVALLSRATNLMRQLKPVAVIVPYDLSGSGGALCAAAKECRVPTVSLVHGAFGRQNAPFFTPLQADAVAVWGRVQAELFVEAGVDRNRIWNCGVFRNRGQRSPQSPERRSSLIKKIGLSEDKPVVVVGLTALVNSEMKAWGEWLVEISKYCADVNIMVRMHPSNSVDDLSEATGSDLPDSVLLVDDSTISSKESLSLADVVVVDSSSFGMDAIEYRIPVVVVAPLNGSGYLAPMLEATEVGAVCYVESPKQAAEALHSLLFERMNKEKLKGEAEIFLAEYYSAYGEDALMTFKEYLNRVLEGGLKNAALKN